MYKIVMSDQAYEWFASRLDLIRRNIKKFPQNYDLEFLQIIDELEGAMLATRKEPNPRQSKKSEEIFEPVKAGSKTAKAPVKPAVPVGNNCEDHPTYGAKRRPRTDCEGCWGLYKKMHPLEYDKARRDFDRKQT